MPACHSYLDAKPQVDICERTQVLREQPVNADFLNSQYAQVQYAQVQYAQVQYAQVQHEQVQHENKSERLLNRTHAEALQLRRDGDLCHLQMRLRSEAAKEPVLAK